MLCISLCLCLCFCLFGIVCYLLCSLYGKELMLPLCPTHISKCPVICYISGNEGDLIHHMLVFNNLSDKNQGFTVLALQIQSNGLHSGI